MGGEKAVASAEGLGRPAHRRKQKLQVPYRPQRLTNTLSNTPKYNTASTKATVTLAAALDGGKSSPLHVHRHGHTHTLGPRLSHLGTIPKAIHSISRTRSSIYAWSCELPRLVWVWLST